MGRAAALKYLLLFTRNDLLLSTGNNHLTRGNPPGEWQEGWLCPCAAGHLSPGPLTAPPLFSQLTQSFPSLLFSGFLFTTRRSLANVNSSVSLLGTFPQQPSRLRTKQTLRLKLIFNPGYFCSCFGTALSYFPHPFRGHHVVDGSNAFILQTLSQGNRRWRSCLGILCVIHFPSFI